MCDQHEEENVFEADFIFGRQSPPSPHYEKGASDQKFQTISQVGLGQKTESREQAAAGPNLLGVPPKRSGWFDDKTKEIGNASSGSQFEFGWVYVRTQTGHRRERTGHRDSVS